MDPDFLKFYNAELQHMRDMGAEFAREYPKIAGRLGLEEFECADPYVERLLEGFAFLAARLQLKVDKEYEKFTQHLFEIVYPHFLAPTPAMCIVQFQPDMNEGSLCEGFRIEPDTALRSRIGRGEQTACEFRTRQRATLWPIEIESADFLPTRGDLSSLGLSTPSATRSGLRLKLRATGGFVFSEMQLDELDFYIRGGGDVAPVLMEQLHAACTGFAAGFTVNGERELIYRSGEDVSMPGFDSDEAILPGSYRSFRGYRLLQEYFAFPERFNFTRMKGLREAVSGNQSEGLELVFFFDRSADVLHNRIGSENFQLNCAPAVNLFERHCDRVHIDDRDTELHVVPDRTRPMDFELHTIVDVQGFRTGVHEGATFKPFFWSSNRGDARSQSAFYTQIRRPRKLSMRQERSGARSSYVGSEVFLTLVDGSCAPYASTTRQVAVKALCTNRDLPLHMPVGGESDFSLLTSAPVTAVKCIKGPTPPRARFHDGDTTWRMVSHLSLNYLSLMNEREGNGAASLREMLELYADTADPALQRQIEGVVSIQAEPIVRRLPMAGPMTAGRGIGIELTLDDNCFEGVGIFLLGRILSEFLARYASINSFTETRVVSTERGDIVRWPMQIGRRMTI